MPKRRPILIALVVLALVGGAAMILVIWPWRTAFDRHFTFPLPPTARLVNHHHSGGGVGGWGHEFQFSFTDDALRDAIVKEWNLTRGGRVVGMAEKTGAAWWPRQATLDALPEKYGRVDPNDPNGVVYRSLWVDRQNGMLYAEFGNP
jgi:hypothetical protein